MSGIASAAIDPSARFAACRAPSAGTVGQLAAQLPPRLHIQRLIDRLRD